MKAIVFADVVDAWSYIGAVRFERAAALYTILTGEPVEIAYRAAAFEASPDAEDVAAAARITGIELNLDEVVPADSTDAWRVLTWAAESGSDVQRELLHQLWRAHLLEGTDVADGFVLASRAALVGLDLETTDALLASDEFRAEVDDQRATAAAIGATSSPFVVVEARYTLAGVHSQDDYLRALQSIATQH
ncbi:DsbA family oxidoreductase [Aeromicrobium duanguangcaii]|uniref:DsbA family protein n=1 Tax=Aeromicrobium duanguangcaii TaxID=2968086 RepID=A0ABY5KGJ6_9ACTN|nr:DsbA family protein [Aeromicrobium duanguangcaii]MCD9155179.1 DsbA family protein [Aeromicrobium duanguangcaii]MCL3838530.1 DsbA family protein [Aeromicrobium duanguangcaii]UUI68170.1 DsbA family protein [Aeromicrobium duanguangcaii]